MNKLIQFFLGDTPFIADNISVRGYSHILVDKECQDSSLSWTEQKYGAIIVCDGHGGEKYIRSAIGSQIACEVGKDIITEYMRKVDNSNRKTDDNLYRLESAIVCAWREKIDSHISENPIDQDPRFANLSDNDRASLLKNPVKAYGSTFIAAVMTKHYCFVLKLGDGNVVLFSEGKGYMPKELVDEELQFNVTTSLCNNDAADSFRHIYVCFNNEESLNGLVITSDGVINCYHSEEAFVKFIENAFSAYGEDSVEDARNELSEVLGVLSKKGSGDDMSFSIIRLQLHSKAVSHSDVVQESQSDDLDAKK